ncbi:hypothetical protein NE236_34510 [Actinoallomurus purpureus]|nr:hypothetical protein [Actinoallomurus purpureus]MCO6010092.1 hypothetical protein [Actinoallomurus purpureus]
MPRRTDLQARTPRLVNLFADIVDDKIDQDQAPAPGTRHLRLVGRDE